MPLAPPTQAMGDRKLTAEWTKNSNGDPYGSPFGEGGIFPDAPLRPSPCRK